MVEVTQEKLLAGARNLKAKGYTPQQVDAWLQSHNSSLDAMKQFVATQNKPVQKMTPEQKANAAQKNAEWLQQVHPKTTGEKLADWMVTNPYSRQAGFALQGISNAGLNPAGYVARAAGLDTRPLEAKNAAERITELAGQYGYDAAAMATGLSGLASAGVGGTGVTGNVIKALAEGGMPLAETSALGSAVLTGGVNPQSTIGRFLTDTAGGVLAPATPSKITQLPRNISAAGKAVKDYFTLAPESNAVKNLREIAKLKRNVNIDSLNEAMAEAERTGRSVLEVGDDAVLQAAQRARQQTPEARQIITKNLQDMLEAQKARTRGVIDENLGTQSKAETVADVMEAAKQKAAPLYNELENIGDLAAYETKDIPEQNFKRWNAGNTIVDENGKPLDLYHGTLNDFDEFSKKMIGSRYTQDDNGFFFIDKENIAKDYATSEFDATRKGKVLPVKVRGKNTLKINSDWAKKNGLGSTVFDREDSISFWDNYHDFIMDEVKKAKADSVIIDDGTQKMVVAFEPNQIKSVNNSGAWSESPSLSDAGWKPESKMANLVKDNPFIQAEIANVRKDLTLPKNVREASDTSFDILNAVKKNIDDKINVAKRGGENELVRRLTGIKEELKGRISDATNGKYAEALGIYEDAFRFRDAADMGRDVFNNRQSVAEFKQNLKKLSASEKDALKIGVRDEMVNKLGSVYNENVANKKFLVDNTRQKLKAVLGDKGGDAVIDEAEQAYKLNQNANSVLSGSQTAEKQGMRDRLQGLRRLFRNPVDTTVDAILSPFDNKNNVRLANALTNPELAKIYNQMRLQQIIAQAKQPQKINWTPYLLAVENYANQ